jgi:hypothetical protein
VEQWTVRYVVRAVVAASLAGIAVAATIWIDNPYIKVVSGVVGALAAYLGIGAASPTVEPFIGVRGERVEVPAAISRPES